MPFGKARMVREGTDVSIITYGAVVHRAEVAAAELSRDGISAEVLDLRSLSPYDWDAIVATVGKDESRTGGLRGYAVVGLRRGDCGANCG